MSCEHGTDDEVDCVLCQTARVAAHMRDERRRHARGLIIALAALAAPPRAAPADADPLAGPFGAELVDMIQSTPPKIIAALREQLKNDAGALRVIDAALAARKVAP